MSVIYYYPDSLIWKKWKQYNVNKQKHAILGNFNFYIFFNNKWFAEIYYKESSIETPTSFDEKFDAKQFCEKFIADFVEASKKRK